MSQIVILRVYYLYDSLCITNSMYMGKSDMYTVFKQDCIKLVGVFQYQLYVCVALSEQMLQINVFLF